MTDSPAASPPPLDPVAPAATADWHPLPARGALLHALGVGFAFALPAAFGVGLLASALLEVSRLPAGIVAGLAGEPFLASQAWHASLPLLGEIHLSTVLLFDLGVYLLVVGATVLMLVAIAHQSLRSQPRKTSTEGGH